MDKDDPVILNRRRLLYAAMLAGGALAGCSAREQETASTDLWAGYDARITERTLAEAEKLFGLEFTEAERRQILGGPIEEREDGFFAEQIASLRQRRQQDIPNSLAPATSFDPRPGGCGR